MKQSIFALVLAACTLFYLPVLAKQARQLTWDDLIQKIEFEDPFEALTPEQLADLSMVARIRGRKAEGKSLSEGMLNDAEASEVRLVAQSIDIEGLLKRRQEIRELREKRAGAVVEELNGQQVRMAGFALPLEFSGEKVTEFLLVPWVGACIHTPPPPPNQIVYVRFDEGIESPGRFSALWVTGKMAVKAASKKLFLVDGSSDIGIGYSLAAGAVEPYQDNN